jgi:hypothetical protein
LPNLTEFSLIREFELLPGAGDVAALDALGLVETAKVGLGHIEGGGRNWRLLRRRIAVGGCRSGRGSGGGRRGGRVTSRRGRSRCGLSDWHVCPVERTQPFSLSGKF